MLIAQFTLDKLVGDLRTQNESLLEKAKRWATDEKKPGFRELQERNRVLSEQLLKSLDGCRSMKRKLRAAHEENGSLRAALDEIVTSLERFKAKNEPEVLALEERAGLSILSCVSIDL
ncbi:myosin heavy chain-related [Striga asiatica]|uniref:Myosin heavy chain-related n=1 Tax=Striga asiatica TaxID=4170 RepID=A0A5A7P0A1_STRAF|nr:myosin heavy chain-related [Striga asiatica]